MMTTTSDPPTFDRTAEKRPIMPQSDPASTATSPPKPARRLLLVDDNAEGRKALARLLQLYNFDVVSAGTGASALEALRTGPAPDIVVTDLILPDLDGREIAREAHALRPTPLVIMITGWDFGTEVPDRETWGIDHIFLKPLNVGDFLSFLQQSAPSPG